MPRLKLTIAYTGTAFAGWQLQLKPGQAEPRTVQGVLEQALNSLLCEMNPKAAFARIHSAGRTDSGVHADGQAAHVDVPESARAVNWRNALNRRLPHDVVIAAAEEVAPDFNARFDAKAKIYNYGLWLEQNYVPPRLKQFVWGTGPLDLAAMDVAAALLIGEHDFRSFQNAGAEPGPTTRTLYSIERHNLPLPGLPAAWPPGLPAGSAEQAETADYVVWAFAGSGFLKQMVRNLMGLLVAVGLGRTKARQVPDILQAHCRRTMPGATAPAQGLCLRKVIY